MKLIKIPAFTEEYKIIAVLGPRKDLVKFLIKEGWTREAATKLWANPSSGKAFNYLPNPLLMVDTDLPYQIIVATLAHEALHCANFIGDFIGVDDKAGEFKCHIVSAVLRHCIPKIKK
jgi:hypothetical protein